VFINRTATIQKNAALLHYGVAVADPDGDGVFEWIVCGYGGPNRILKVTDAGLTDAGDAAFGDVGRQAIGVAAGDLDADGREEVYILNTDTFGGAKRHGDRLFRRDENRWIDLFEEPRNHAALNLTAGRSVCAVDRRGVGRYGFFVANYGGAMRLYELDADGNLVDVAGEAGVDLATGGRCVLSLPLVSPRMDIFVGNEGDANFLFRNLGDGTFVEVAQSWGLADEEEAARGATAFDADGDGRFDLALGNWEGPHRLFVRSPSQKFRDLAPTAWATPSRVRTVIAADFDNDGREEVFFNNIGQPNRLFGWRRGQWVPLDVGDALEPHGLGTGAAVGDLDNDGRLELLIAHGETGAQPLTLYHGPKTEHHWLRVLPLTAAGAPARGAAVTIARGDRLQIRVIDAGSGYLCQMEPVAHFGLGRDEAVDSVVVQWPDGATSELKNPAIDRRHVVCHPG
jgi:hypothetical protein